MAYSYYYLLFILTIMIIMVKIIPQTLLLNNQEYYYMSHLSFPLLKLELPIESLAKKCLEFNFPIKLNLVHL